MIFTFLSRKYGKYEKMFSTSLMILKTNISHTHTIIDVF